MFPEEYPPLPQTERPPRPRSRLLKARACTVPYPDGTEGSCTYERLGPACHRFDYRYEDGESLPRQLWTWPLTNTVEAIEAKARELAERCFFAAIAAERKDYFARATEPTSGARKADPGKYRIPANRAKRLGGYYALCLRLGGALVPVSLAFSRIHDAGLLWEKRKSERYVIGCCNRLDRCWEMVKYNPWTRQGHPRKEKEAER